MEKTIARSHPHACPVCKGRGELTEELAQYTSKLKHDVKGHKIYACHVCMGAGIVWEIYEAPAPAEQPTIAPLPPYGSIPLSPNVGFPNTTWTNGTASESQNSKDHIAAINRV